MSSSIRGYLVQKNLSETTDDRQSLNNIGGAPVADDIALFVNNTKNQSVISIRADEYDSSTDTVVINNQTTTEVNERSAVFTNRDKVFLVDVDDNVIAENLYIANSNTIDRFQVSAKQDLSEIYSINVPTQSDSNDYVLRFVRNDSVTFENLQNLGVESSGVEVDLPESDNNTDEESATVSVGNYESEFNTISSVIDLANFQSRNKFVSNDSIQTSIRLRTEGAVIVADPSDTIITEGIVESSPGLYLSDPTSDVDDVQVTRAFSSSSNPWSDDNAGTLSTDSVDVTSGNLNLTNGVTIDGIPVIPEDGSVDSETFTHKVKIQVNGIDYYLCLTT